MVSPPQKTTLVPTAFDGNSSYRADFPQHEVSRRVLPPKAASTVTDTAFDANSSYREWPC